MGDLFRETGSLTPGQKNVGASDFHGLVDGLALKASALTGKGSFSAPTGAETLLIYDPASQELRKATVADLLLQADALIADRGEATTPGGGVMALVYDPGADVYRKVSRENLLHDKTVLEDVFGLAEANAADGDWVPVWDSGAGAVRKVSRGDLRAIAPDDVTETEVAASAVGEGLSGGGGAKLALAVDGLASQSAADSADADAAVFFDASAGEHVKLTLAELRKLGQGAVKQALLDGTEAVNNHSGEGTDPVVGVRGEEDAFWLVQDDNGNAMDLDLALQAASSQARLSVRAFVDTASSWAGVGFRLERSVDGGTTWTPIGLGEAAGGRLRVSFTVGHGPERRHVSCAAFDMIDAPGSATARYRVIYTVHPGQWLYLNRDFNIDADGDSGVVKAQEMRCSSTFIAQEVFA